MVIPLPTKMLGQRARLTKAVRTKTKVKQPRPPLPPKTFEVVEFAAGKPENLARMAKKDPNRIYIVVDSAYNSERNLKEIARLVELGLDPYDNIKRPQGTALLTSSSKMEHFIDWMKQHGLRTRNIHLRMPDPQYVQQAGLFDLRKLFTEAKNILIPNGKLIITLNTTWMLEMVLRMAKENGLSARKPKRLTTVLRARIGDDPSTKIVVVRSIHEQRLIARGRPVYLIEFTYGLKQAFPKKEERKKWPHN